MAVVYPTYPVTTLAQAEDMIIFTGNQIHDIMNADATSVIEAEDGQIPSIRKALVDNMYFKPPQDWVASTQITDPLQLKQFTDGGWYFAPTATVSTPVSLGVTPIGDTNWKSWNKDQAAVYQHAKRLAAEAGYNMVSGSFYFGGTLDSVDDVLFFEGDGKNYSWSGAFPKVVAASSTPATSGGVGDGAWVDRTQEALRSELTSGDGSLVSVEVTEQTKKTGTYLKTLSDIANGSTISSRSFINKNHIGNIRDGVSDYDCLSDLTDLFHCGATDIYVERGKYKYAGNLSTIESVNIRGAGSSKYAVLGALAEETLKRSTTFAPQHSGGGTSGISLGAFSSLKSVNVIGPNSRPYYATEITEVNPEVGVWLGISANMEDVTTMYFNTTGVEYNQTSKLTRCHSFMNARGFNARSTGTDAEIEGCVGMFNTHAGIDAANNFQQIRGGRYEWNAKYGIILGGESILTGAVVDRNGKAGLVLGASGWGQVVVGNYFCRNGCGGNGVSGRWFFSVPGHPSYIAVNEEESAHILMNFARAITIQGNRYRAGLDDSNTGALGPAYVYSSTDADGATPYHGGTDISGNFGDNVKDAVKGWGGAQSYAIASGLPAGGTDTQLKDGINKGRVDSNGGVFGDVTGRSGPLTNSSTVSFDILSGTDCDVLLTAKDAFNSGTYRVVVSSNALSDYYTPVIIDMQTNTKLTLGSSLFSSATVTPATDTRYKTVTLVLTSSRYWKLGTIMEA